MILRDSGLKTDKESFFDPFFDREAVERRREMGEGRFPFWLVFLAVLLFWGSLFFLIGMLILPIGLADIGQAMMEFPLRVLVLIHTGGDLSVWGMGPGELLCGIFVLGLIFGILSVGTGIVEP